MIFVCFKTLSICSCLTHISHLPTPAFQWPPRHHKRGTHPDTEGRPHWDATIRWGRTISSHLRLPFGCNEDLCELDDIIFIRGPKGSIFSVLLQFLLPLIIEKLDSDVQSAKLDSLQTLVRNLYYHIVVCSVWYLNIWLVLCQLIFPTAGSLNVDDIQLIFSLNNTHYNCSGAAETPRAGVVFMSNLWRWCRVLLEKLYLFCLFLFVFF